MSDEKLKDKPSLVSIVVPCYNEHGNVGAMFERVSKVMNDGGFVYELVFVNDGSKDATLSDLLHLAREHREVKVVDFSRNFGHQVAVTAGMAHARGDVVVLIDADLQDPPELIVQFINEWQKGYDVVYAIREKRLGETWFKRMTAKMFYRTMRKATSLPIPLDTGDFRLMSRDVVDHLNEMPEKHRFIRGMVTWVGFNQTGVPYVRSERNAGETKYPFKKMLKFAFDGITSFSDVPLKIATRFGFVAALVGFLLGVIAVCLRLFTKVTIEGWTSLALFILFFGGIQLLMLGAVGDYVGRIYDEVRQRPLYIVRKTYNMDAENK